MKKPAGLHVTCFIVLKQKPSGLHVGEEVAESFYSAATLLEQHENPSPHKALVTVEEFKPYRPKCFIAMTSSQGTETQLVAVHSVGCRKQANSSW